MVAQSVVPLLLEAMTSTYQQILPDALTDLGYILSDESSRVSVMVGRDVLSSGPGVSVTGEWAGSNHTPMERRGDVTVSLVAWNGDADAQQALDDVYGAFHTIAAYHRDPATTAFGLASEGLQWTRPGADERLSMDQDETGAWAVLVFTINLYQYLSP
jgi:hypothetical protein